MKQLFLMLVTAMTVFSCTKEEIDFRDDIVGDYHGVRSYYSAHLNSGAGAMWAVEQDDALHQTLHVTKGKGIIQLR
ncbi:MAG: hypothetical protein ACKOXB_09845 [Flavobacteriales bacterium]